MIQSQNSEQHTLSNRKAIDYTHTHIAQLSAQSLKWKLKCSNPFILPSMDVHFFGGTFSALITNIKHEQLVFTSSLVLCLRVCLFYPSCAFCLFFCINHVTTQCAYHDQAETIHNLPQNKYRIESELKRTQNLLYEIRETQKKGLEKQDD